jgi:hypothetical protein
MIDRPLFVRREPELGKEKEVGLPSVRTATYGVSFGRRTQPSSASSGSGNMNGHASDAAMQPSTVAP